MEAETELPEVEDSFPTGGMQLDEEDLDFFDHAGKCISSSHASNHA